MGVAVSGFYARLRHGPGRCREADRRVGERIAAAVAASRRTGACPRARAAGPGGQPARAAELRAEGVRVGRKRVARVMREAGLSVTRRRRVPRTTDSRHDLPVAPNLLERRFAADRPDTVWLADISSRIPHLDWADGPESRRNAGEIADSFFHPSRLSGLGCPVRRKNLISQWKSVHVAGKMPTHPGNPGSYVPTGEGWPYLATIEDLATREIVGWSMAAHLRGELARDALLMAVRRRQPSPGLVHHSDRGVRGGFKWSSQRLDRGVRDGRRWPGTESPGR